MRDVIIAVRSRLFHPPSTMPSITFHPVKAALGTISFVLSVGTLYSVLNSTYLDTSNPLLSHLPHPLQSTDYFANKSNLLNTVFIKKAWGWTSGAFALLYVTSPARLRSSDRLLKYVVVTLAWLAFAGWFFGPPLIERVVVASGGQCVVTVPSSGEVIDVPVEYCYTKSTLSPATHPTLFTSLTAEFTTAAPWSARPRLRRGHDVSGHIFLLATSVLFLADQITPSLRSASLWTAAHNLAVTANVVLIAIWVFATYTTAIYFHTPFEKFTGFREWLFLCLAGTVLTRRFSSSPRHCCVRPYPVILVEFASDRNGPDTGQQE
jgi:hypothetical protein